MRPVLKTYSRPKNKKVKQWFKDATECSSNVLLCCRGCLATDRSLFNIHDYKLADALAHIIGSPVFKDKLPQHMCLYCCSFLLKCEAFRDMCLHTQRSLTAELLKGKLDLEGVRKINRPFNQYIDLTLCEVNTVQYIDLDEPPDDVDLDDLNDNIKGELETIEGIDNIINDDIKEDRVINIVGIDGNTNNDIELEPEIKIVVIDGHTNDNIGEEPEINIAGIGDNTNDDIENEPDPIEGIDCNINDGNEEKPNVNIVGIDDNKNDDIEEEPEISVVGIDDNDDIAKEPDPIEGIDCNKNDGNEEEPELSIVGIDDNDDIENEPNPIEGIDCNINDGNEEEPEINNVGIDNSTNDDIEEEPEITIAGIDDNDDIEREPDPIEDIDGNINDGNEEDPDTVVVTIGIINDDIEEAQEVEIISIDGVEKESETVVELYGIINNYIEKEPAIKTIGIDGVINKNDLTAKFDTQKRFLNISDDKLKYINNRLRKIGNALKKKKGKAIGNINDENGVTETQIKKRVIDIKHRQRKKTLKKIQEPPKKRQQPLKKRQEKVKKAVRVKRKRIGTKTREKSKTDKSKVKEVKSKKDRKKWRVPENDFMPVFDFAKYESAYAVKIVTLTKEEQLEEIATRKKSPLYLESRFQCEDCGKAFNVRRHFNKHRVRHSPTKGEFPCEICGLHYKRAIERLRHHEKHWIKFICNYCEHVTREKMQAKKHYAMHAGTFTCQHCGKFFREASKYVKHVRSVHSALSPSCDECEETFVSQLGLELHKMSAHFEKPPQIKCTLCSALFSSRQALNRHTDTVAEHSELRPCEQCGENCASETELQEHVKEKHPKATYYCTECDMTFGTAPSCESHYKRKHPGLYYTGTTPGNMNEWYPQPPRRHPPKKEYMCEKCGHIAKASSALRAHLHTHLEVKQFTCDLCSKSFISKALLKYHILTHTSEKPYQCPECPLAFRLQDNFKRHHKTVHQGIRDNLPCPICGRVLSRKASLPLHIKMVHGGERSPKTNRKQAKKSSRV